MFGFITKKSDFMFGFVQDAKKNNSVRLQSRYYKLERKPNS